ncbi:MAG: NOL1/NOP2/sun family putative RNA methylase [Clostridiales bacterium]|nr:NOL1/NOP2/sun family putative RNA methylase [Candidatus Apopatousia equi]
MKHKSFNNYKKNKYSIEDKSLPLPSDFLIDFENSFGKESLEMLKISHTEKSLKGLRVNNQKISNESFINNFDYEIEKVPYFDGAYYLNTDEKLGNTSLHQAGAFYIQEPSSMIPVASVKNLDFNNKVILDLCASPGGKSTQIASLMNNTGVLVSNEIDYKRAKILFSNIERMGYENVIVSNETPLNLSNKFQNTFDYIFVDAPCSGEGMFRKDNDAISNWNCNLKFSLQKTQLEILDCANKMLKNGGIIVYSTCTFNTVENEQVVDIFTNKYGYEIVLPQSEVVNCTVAGLELNNNDKLSNTRHFFPFNFRGEGQFVAVMKKHDGNTSENTCNNKKSNVVSEKITSQEIQFVKNFIKSNLNYGNIDDLHFEKINGKINIYKTEFNTTGLNVLSKGVIFGDIKNGVITLHHQFFSAYGKYFKSFVDFKSDSDFVKRYMKGEELDVSLLSNSTDVIDCNIVDTDYAVIKVCGASLSGVKIVNGKLKNHYPKALRINLI